jgi:hypothetical protein
MVEEGGSPVRRKVVEMTQDISWLENRGVKVQAGELGNWPCSRSKHRMCQK